MNLKRKATIPVCSVVSWNVCACYTWLYFAYFGRRWSQSYRFNRLSQTSPCLCLHYTVNWAQSGADPGLHCSPSSPSLLGLHSLALKYILLLPLYTAQLCKKRMKRLDLEQFGHHYILGSQLPQSTEGKMARHLLYGCGVPKWRGTVGLLQPQVLSLWVPHSWVYSMACQKYSERSVLCLYWTCKTYFCLMIPSKKTAN